MLKKKLSDRFVERFQGVTVTQAINMQLELYFWRKDFLDAPPGSSYDFEVGLQLERFILRITTDSFYAKLLKLSQTTCLRSFIPEHWSRVHHFRLLLEHGLLELCI